jgi:prevent-host-death family protein
MREIGVRELKACLSETLRAVRRGERVRVTVRGRPVADLVPAGASPRERLLQALAADGRLTPATRRRPASPPRLARAATPASSLVLAERDAER